MTQNKVFQNFVMDEKSNFDCDYRSDPVTNAVVGNIMAQLPVKKPKVSLYCNVCSLEFSSQIPLDMHLNGARHAKRLKSQEILTNLKDDAQGFQEQVSSNGSFFKCEICSVVVNSSQQLQTHLTGNKHKQKLLKRGASDMDTSMPAAKAPKLEPQENSNAGTRMNSTKAFTGIQELPQGVNKVTRFFCDTCQLDLNSNIQLQQHIGSKKHLDKTMNANQPKPRQFQARGKKKTQPLLRGNPPIFRGPHLQDSFVIGRPMI